MSEKILTLHPQGKQGVNIDRSKYDTMRNAIVEALGEQSEMTFTELNKAVGAKLEGSFDGSVGWYEAGWGPMMSETAHFVKDIVSPNGAVSIVTLSDHDSDSVEGHTKVGTLKIHRAGGDELVDFPGEPGHQELCDAEQAFVLRAIAQDIDLARHAQDAVQSLRICLAADESIRSGRAIDL